MLMTSNASVVANGRTDQLRAFSALLLSKNYLSGNSDRVDASVNEREAEPSLRQIWESTELSANDFAEEVAAFYGLPRLTLPQLVEARSLAARFTHRFLRESTIFPFEAAPGKIKLAVAHPSDQAALQAARICLCPGLDGPNAP